MTPRKHSKVVARLQSRPPIWLLEDQEGLSLQEVADRSGCSKRRIRRLIELGLVDGARKVGSKSAYNELHVRQARAVRRLLDEGQYSLMNLAWLNNPDSILVLNLAEELAAQEFLFALFKSKEDCGIDEQVNSRSIKPSPFQKRVLVAISSVVKSTVVAERILVSEVKEALKAAIKLSG